jgi:hypothetical protein
MSSRKRSRRHSRIVNAGPHGGGGERDAPQELAEREQRREAAGRMRAQHERKNQQARDRGAA